MHHYTKNGCQYDQGQPCQHPVRQGFCQNQQKQRLRLKHKLFQGAVVKVVAEQMIQRQQYRQQRCYPENAGSCLAQK